VASIAKRPDGTYRPRYRDENGKEHARHFKRRVDAQRWLDEVTAAMVTGDYVDPAAGKITFKAWFKACSGRQVWERGTTLAAQQAADSVTFADVPMRQIRPSHVQQWVKAMSQPASSRTSGLAPTTIRTRYNYVHMAMRAAVVDRIIKADPSAGVPLPRARKAAAAMTIPTVEEVGRALSVAPVWFRPFIAVCAFAGLRLGEAAGLRLEDVDFLRRTISIRHQMQGETNAMAELVAPKFGSERVVYAPAELIALLAEHVRRAGVQQGRLAVLQRRGAAEPELSGPPVAAGPKGGGARRVHAARPEALLRERAHRVGVRRGDGAAGARALVGDDHARRLLAPVAHGRGPHARRSRRPHGRRAGRLCGLTADRGAVDVL
jgi:integrase